MYKLLTTAAVIMTVATPSFAWTGAKDLISGLNDVYTGVDGAGTGGSGHFESLQTGALGNFVTTANLGVTHVVLNVSDGTDGNVANTIHASIEGGTSLASIQTAQSNLINQVNYDLFVDVDSGTIEAFDSPEGGFDLVNDPNTVPTNPGGTPITEVNNDGTVNWANANSGLVGVKVDKVVGSANAINDYLTSEDGAGTDTTAFITAFEAGTGIFGTANIGNLFAHIDGGTLTDGNGDATGTVGGINNSIVAAQNAGGTFFGNINDQQGDNAVDGSTIGNFQVTGFTGTSVNDGTTTFPTLLDWANGTNGTAN